jgi:hypothetical protein
MENEVKEKLNSITNKIKSAMQDLKDINVMLGTCEFAYEVVQLQEFLSIDHDEAGFIAHVKNI